MFHLGLAEAPEFTNTILDNNSQISDGPSNGSKQLVICELWQ
jgi:hypothetical protein